MLILYDKTDCPYCEVVLEELDELGLKAELRNIADKGVAEELVDRGGKRQVPYLVDEEHDVEMYESEDIVEYLRETYGATA
ncbi:MAG: glutathione S-transferase N-terminal domain-containing protein [Patescibacteria group bacterium]|nr:glutathione S-transferase N-terminal domain-containing protein [Patescibacteria group bacterium]